MHAGTSGGGTDQHIDARPYGNAQGVEGGGEPMTAIARAWAWPPFRLRQRFLAARPGWREHFYKPLVRAILGRGVKDQ